MSNSADKGLHPCQRKPHYGEPCECEARLALVVTHTRASTGGMGPDFCSECSQAISEWVPWPCEKAAEFPYWREGETGVFPPTEGDPS